MLAPCRDAGALRAVGLVSWLALALLRCTAVASPAHAPSPPAKPRWGGFEAARAWAPVLPARPSRGHGVDRSTVEIHVSPGAEAAYLGLVAGSVMPAGAVVAAFHRTAEGAPGSVYVMIRREGSAWDFLVTDPDGRLVGSGDLPLCLGCHQEARADSLFIPSGAPAAGAGN